MHTNSYNICDNLSIFTITRIIPNLKSCCSFFDFLAFVFRCFVCWNCEGNAENTNTMLKEADRKANKCDAITGAILLNFVKYPSMLLFGFLS